MLNPLKIHSLFIISLMLFSLYTSAQSIEFKERNFPNQIEAYKVAKRNYQDGNNHFNNGFYHAALSHYLAAHKFNPKHALLNYQIGLCYLNNIEHYKSLPYLEQAFLLNRKVNPQIHLMMGRAYHVNSEFDKAINEFKAYLNLGKATDEQKQQINKYIAECETAKVLIKKDSRAFVDNMGSKINSEYDDHSPLISADAQLLIFTSSRENGRKPGPDGHYDEDIYLSRRGDKGWLTAQPFGPPVNSASNDATSGLSPDGQQMLIFNGTKGGGDIQTCYLEGDRWDFPKSLDKNINSEYRESSASFSADGNTLYFVSERPGGEGGKDIWVSKRNEIESSWEPPINLGGTINTPYDEETVFLHPDGRKLYFSSKGHQNMGGFDIFVSYLQANGNWSKPENMGHPINSPDDDLCFVISANGRYGYCSSVRPGGMGGLDVYKMTFMGTEKPLIFINEEQLISTSKSSTQEQYTETTVELNDIRLTMVKGNVLSHENKKPLQAKLDIIDNTNNQVLFSTQTNSSTGSFLISLPSGKNYGLLISAENHLLQSNNYNTTTSRGYAEISEQIMLHPIKTEAVITLNNIFYKQGLAELEHSSHMELNALYKHLDKYKNLNIAFHNFNPVRADKDVILYNKRVQSAIEYLLSKGLTPQRIQLKIVDKPLPKNSKGNRQKQILNIEIIGA